MSAQSFKQSPQQKAVTDWVINGTGSLELIARAGCGKTTTLMQAVATIVERNLGDVAIMAYNKSIATELQNRLKTAGYDWRTAQAGTVHSFGFSVWRKVAPNVIVDGKKVFTIIDGLKSSEEARMFVECGPTIAKLVGYGKQRAIGHLCPIDDINVWFDLWDHFDLENDLADGWTAEEVIRAAVRVYRLSLERCREVIDFDDMILAPLFYRARFWPRRWVLVDESQDTNAARRALALAMLSPRDGRMIFVGDDKQAIYGFTGADSNSMSQLREATKAITLPLTVTYRCPKLVVKDAQRLVPDIQAHESAPEGVVRAVSFEDMLTKETLGKTDVILCRNTAPLIQTAYALFARGIACRVEGREIGDGIVKLARRWKIGTLDKLLVKLDDYEARMTAKFMSKNQEEKVGPLVDQIECLRVIINRCLLAKKHTVDELVSDIKGMFGDTPDGEDPRVLTLSTVHKSKGREWPRVYLLGRTQFMPSPYAKKTWQLDQESNLEYVAITRAQQELIDVSAPPKEDKKA